MGTVVLRISTAVTCALRYFYVRPEKSRRVQLNRSVLLDKLFCCIHSVILTEKAGVLFYISSLCLSQDHHLNSLTKGTNSLKMQLSNQLKGHFDNLNCRKMQNKSMKSFMLYVNIITIVNHQFEMSEMTVFVYLSVRIRTICSGF